MRHETEYKNKMPFECQRAIERELRRQALQRKRPIAAQRQRSTLILTMMLFVALALLSGIDLWSNEAQVYAKEDTMIYESKHVLAVRKVSVPDISATPLRDET